MLAVGYRPRKFSAETFTLPSFILRLPKRSSTQLEDGSKISRMKNEILFGAVVNLAAGLRPRPVMEIGDFERGPWRTQQWNSELKLSPSLYNDLKLAFSETPYSPPLKSTSITPRLRAMSDYMKELLAVGDLKFKYATSKSFVTTHIFRWSHARKISAVLFIIGAASMGLRNKAGCHSSYSMYL